MPAARPRIEGKTVTVEPVIMNCKYNLPWNRQSSQTACGQVIQQQVGAKNWRVTVEGIMTKEQLNTFMQMRDEEVVSVITEEMGEAPVAFDTLQVERASEDAVGHIEGVEGPVLHFQLQTKEDTNEEGEGIQFFNENTRGATFPGED